MSEYAMPFNFKKWIDENRHLLKPPVGNKEVYKSGDFIIMVVGGPNSRKDFHYDVGGEFFYQLEGDMLLKVHEKGKIKDIPIKEGEVFLLPPEIPHSPQRFENTVGLVIERVRKPEEKDGFMWFCDNCHEKLYEEFLHVSDIVKDLPPVFERFFSSEENRTCKECGHKMEKPS